MPEDALHAVHVVFLEVAVCAEMIAHHDCHYLALGHPALPVAEALPIDSGRWQFEIIL